MSSVGRDVTKEHECRPAKRLFTLAEANRSLVLVRRIVADVIVEHARMLDLQELLEAAEDKQADEQADEARRALLKTAGRLRSCLAELDDVGVELADWSLGVVDFPCLAGGRQVQLCWQYGESKVGHWHELGAGFTGRQGLDTLPQEGRYVARPARPRSAVAHASGRPESGEDKGCLEKPI